MNQNDRQVIEGLFGNPCHASLAQPNGDPEAEALIAGLMEHLQRGPKPQAGRLFDGSQPQQTSHLAIGGLKGDTASARIRGLVH